jgi:hypothetical protein
MLGRNPPVIL